MKKSDFIGFIPNPGFKSNSMLTVGSNVVDGKRAYAVCDPRKISDSASHLAPPGSEMLLVRFAHGHHRGRAGRRDGKGCLEQPFFGETATAAPSGGGHQYFARACVSSSRPSAAK